MSKPSVELSAGGFFILKEDFIVNMKKWMGHRFVSSSGLTEEFDEFQKGFKKHITGLLPTGSKLVNWNRGHFYISGFIKKGEKFVYFSIGDVRGSPDGWYNHILVRTAKNDKDYTGGSNGFSPLQDFTENVERLIGMPLVDTEGRFRNVKAEIRF